MGLSKKKRQANIGRFVNDGRGQMVYVDDFERVWTQENISDLVNAFRKLKFLIAITEHYKKLL